MNINKVLFVLLIIVLLYGIFGPYINRKKTNTIESFTQCDYDHLVLNKVQMDDLKELLVHLIDFFKTNNIEYFALAGTLIGTIRHGGLMPHDDDIDIGVFDKDIQKIEQYKDEMFYFKTQGFGYKYQKQGSNMFIDIMVFEKKGDKYFILDNLWTNEAIYEDEIFPLVTKTYNEIDIHVPQKYTQYLNRAFPEWDTKIKLGNLHHADNILFNEKNLPEEFDLNYDNSKYLCYSKFD